jgi:hypothetical protein
MMQALIDQYTQLRNDAELHLGRGMSTTSRIAMSSMHSPALAPNKRCSSRSRWHRMPLFATINGVGTGAKATVDTISERLRSLSRHCGIWMERRRCAMPQRFKHKLDRHLSQAQVPRCKQCAEHCETSCSSCRKPVCLRHNAAPSHSLEILCLDCVLVGTPSIVALPPKSNSGRLSCG